MKEKYLCRMGVRHSEKALLLYDFAIPMEWIDEVKQSPKPAGEDQRQIDSQPVNAWSKLGITYYQLNRYKKTIEA